MGLHWHPSIHCPLLTAAVAHLQQRPDKRWSLCDGVSFPAHVPARRLGSIDNRPSLRTSRIRSTAESYELPGVGILLGSFVLHHFGNDLFEIALFVLCDVAPRLPGLLRRLPNAAASQPKRQSEPAAGTGRWLVSVGRRLRPA
jgi:hypothetical protein